ncbi:MAG: type I-U CRISPR-associated protein Csb2 [Alphaproteobacteria bacterium]|nr:type I-U CRISPR-associated protein Csb2 [Alphaproteobacteria bacterium]
MAQALLVAVRFHDGRYHGTGDWPPAPGRLFQALIAGAARGADLPDKAREALDWLEELAPPAIAAPRCVQGQTRRAYVPNNDLDAELRKRDTKILDRAVAAIRVPKTLRPMLFDAAMPILYCWLLTGSGNSHAARICAMANDLYCLGLGIDMAWAEAVILNAREAEAQLYAHGGVVYRPSERGASSVELPCPRPGTRRSLTDRFDATRSRFRSGGTNRKPVNVFVQPPKPRLVKVAYEAPPHRFVFVLGSGEAGGGFAPRPLRKTAALVKEARDWAASKLHDGAPGLSDEIERQLVGRGATDSDKAARIQIVPIPSVGHEHADMKIRRLAIHVPQSCWLRPDDVAWAFAQASWTDLDGVVVCELLRAGDEDAMVGRYLRKGRRWRSVTPLALPTAQRGRTASVRRGGDTKSGGERAEDEMRAAGAVVQALRHAGIRAKPAEVRVQREPFQRKGERAEAFAADTRFAREALWHAEIVFAEPVAGPLLLGDGRYLGLGLLRSEEPLSGVLAFSMLEGLSDAADAASIVRAARRAMMARVQVHLSPGEMLPTYVSGHEDSGSPARSGMHRHIFVVADMARRRLLYIAPNRRQRSMGWNEVARDHSLVERALEGMDVLRAGRAGRLLLEPAVLDAETDPLFASARVWESETDYHVARHRRLTDEESIAEDIRVELDCIGRPGPQSVEILTAQRGPRSGLSGRARITFATAQVGPVIIGRTAHKGGGVFAGRK